MFEAFPLVYLEALETVETGRRRNFLSLCTLVASQLIREALVIGIYTLRCGDALEKA